MGNFSQTSKPTSTAGCQPPGSSPLCAMAKDMNAALSKAAAATIERHTGKKVDCMATEKSPMEGQPYITNADNSKCKSKAYKLENNGVIQRFNRYREAMPYANAAYDLNQLNNDKGDTRKEERKAQCLEMLPESTKELNIALGLPENTIKDTDLLNNKTGFRAAIYRSKATGKLILVARDTQPKSLVDWKTNIDNGKGIDTAQYKAMRNLTGKLTKKKIVFDLSGYSKGGGLAQEAGLISTGSKVKVFNSAGLHEASLERSGIVGGGFIKTPDENFDYLADRTQAFSSEGDMLTFMNETTDPDKQIENARILRDELAGEGSWTKPLDISYRNPEMEKADDEISSDEDGSVPTFSESKETFIKELDDMIKEAEKKHKNGEKFVLFPPVRANQKEVLPNSIGDVAFKYKLARSDKGVRNDKLNLSKMVQHKMKNVIDGLERTIEADKKELQDFVQSCG